MAVTVTSDTSNTSPDGSVTRTIVYSDGSQSVQYTPGAGTSAANQATLLGKAQTALTNNANYLAIASPTNAQVSAQVAALTRQIDALIRIDINQLDSTAGT